MPAKVAGAVERLRQTYLTGGIRAGKTFDPNEAAALIKKVGGSDAEARALSTKIIGESAGRPKAIGHDPGGTTGLGLWQMTTGVGNDDLIAKYGGPKAMLKPKPNAKAALELYRGGGLANWYAPSNPPGDPTLARMKGPSKKDLAIVKAAGLKPKAIKQKVLNSKPFANNSDFNRARIINPKWDSDTDGHSLTLLAKGISKPVKKWAMKYDVTVGEAKASSGHVSPGHLQTGTATDVYPRENTPAGWDKLERGLAVLASRGFEVGYDGSRVPGTQSWPNHGRGNHAHIEWLGQGSTPQALASLTNMTEKQVRKFEARAGAGGGGVSGGGVAGGSYASGGAAGGGGATGAPGAPGAPGTDAAQVFAPFIGSTFQRGQSPLAARAALPQSATEALATLEGSQGTSGLLGNLLKGRGRYKPRERR